MLNWLEKKSMKIQFYNFGKIGFKKITENSSWKKLIGIKFEKKWIKIQLEKID